MNIGKEVTTTCVMERTGGEREGVEDLYQDFEKIKKILVEDAAEEDTPLNFINKAVQSDIEAALSEIRRCLTQEHITEIQRLVEKIMEDETSRKSEQEKRASDLREIEGFLEVLEQRCINLNSLLQDQKELHRMDMRALERVRVQERAEWERQMTEKEEDFLSSLLYSAISREMVMKDPRNQEKRQVSLWQYALVIFFFLFTKTS